MDAIDRAPGIRPKPTLGRRLDAMARAAFPGFSTLLLMLLPAAPFGFAGQAVLLPAIAVVCVHFWSTFRPTSMPAPVVFLFGLALDLLGCLPIGLGVFLLLLVHAVAVRWRHFVARQPFLMVWLAFFVVAAGEALLQWALGSVLLFRLLPIGLAGFQCALATALYPALAIPFARAHRGIADPKQA